MTENELWARVIDTCSLLAGKTLFDEFVEEAFEGLGSRVDAHVYTPGSGIEIKIGPGRFTWT